MAILVTVIGATMLSSAAAMMDARIRGTDMQTKDARDLTDRPNAGDAHFELHTAHMGMQPRRALLDTSNLGLRSVRMKMRKAKPLTDIASKYGAGPIRRHESLFNKKSPLKGLKHKDVVQHHDGTLGSPHLVADSRYRLTKSLTNSHGEKVAKNIDRNLHDPDKGVKPKGHGYVQHVHKLATGYKHSKEWQDTMRRIGSGKPEHIEKHAKWLDKVNNAQTNKEWHRKVIKTGAHPHDHLAAHHRVTGIGPKPKVQPKGQSRATIGKFRPHDASSAPWKNPVPKKSPWRASPSSPSSAGSSKQYAFAEASAGK